MFWPNIVNANCLIDTHCCRDLQRPLVVCCFSGPSPLPSLLCVHLSLHVVFLSLPPSPHLHQRPGGVIVYGREAGDSLAKPLHPTYPTTLQPSTLCLIRPGQIEGAAGLLLGCSWLRWGWCIRTGCWDNSMKVLLLRGMARPKQHPHL